MMDMTTTAGTFNPFDLSNTTAYRRWREWKLDAYPATARELLVPVRDAERLTAGEHATLLACCRRTNMVLYEISGGKPAGKEAIRALGRRFGLRRLDSNLRADEDSITVLRVVPGAAGTHYIPYTDRPLNWHTDGYYNTPDEQVRGIIMHCVAEPAAGGENAFLDPELAYIRLRDENPGYIAALMQPDVMTIPPNEEAGVELRAAQSGPVFSIEKDSGGLHMRYTARTRSISWKDDRTTRLATGFLSELLASDSECIFKHRLKAGQGIICNNVLHRRAAFTDDRGAGRERLMYRARYYDRIAGTGIRDLEVANALVE
jgi:hypothetical protein